MSTILTSVAASQRYYFPELLTQIAHSNVILLLSKDTFPYSWLSKWHHHSLKYSSQKLIAILHTLNFQTLYIIFRNVSSVPPFLHQSPPPQSRSLFSLTWDHTSGLLIHNPPLHMCHTMLLIKTCNSLLAPSK